MNKLISKCLIFIIIVAFLSCSKDGNTSTTPNDSSSTTKEYNLAVGFVNTSISTIPNAKLTVTWDGLSSPKEITSVADIIKVPENKVVTFTLSGTSINTIIVWSGDITATSGITKTLTMNSDKTVALAISETVTPPEPTSYTLTLTTFSTGGLPGPGIVASWAGESGKALSLNTPITIPKNTVVSLKLYPNGDLSSKTVSWNGATVNSLDQTEATVTMNKNVNLTVLIMTK